MMKSKLSNSLILQDNQLMEDSKKPGINEAGSPQFDPRSKRNGARK